MAVATGRLCGDTVGVRLHRVDRPAKRELAVRSHFQRHHAVARRLERDRLAAAPPRVCASRQQHMSVGECVPPYPVPARRPLEPIANHNTLPLSRTAFPDRMHLDAPMPPRAGLPPIVPGASREIERRIMCGEMGDTETKVVHLANQNARLRADLRQLSAAHRALSAAFERAVQADALRS